MADTIIAPDTTVEVRRTIRAPRRRVFDAWTQAEELKRWHAPGPMTVALAEIDRRFPADDLSGAENDNGHAHHEGGPSRAPVRSGELFS